MPLIKLDGRSIQFSDSMKYLGITQNKGNYCPCLFYPFYLNISLDKLNHYNFDDKH